MAGEKIVSIEGQQYPVYRRFYDGIIVDSLVASNPEEDKILNYNLPLPVPSRSSDYLALVEYLAKREGPLSRIRMEHRDAVLATMQLPNRNTHFSLIAFANPNELIDMNLNSSNSASRACTGKYAYNGSIRSVISGEGWDVDKGVPLVAKNLASFVDALERSGVAGERLVDETVEAWERYKSVYAKYNTVACAAFEPFNVVTFYEDTDRHESHQSSKAEPLRLNHVYEFFTDRYKVERSDGDNLVVMHAQRENNELLTVYLPVMLPQGLRESLLDMNSPEWVKKLTDVGVNVVKTQAEPLTFRD